MIAKTGHGVRCSRRVASLIAEGLDQVAIEGAAESRRIEMQQRAIQPLADVQRRNAKVGHQASAGPARSAARAAAARDAMRSASAAMARRPSGSYAIVAAALIVGIGGGTALGLDHQPIVEHAAQQPVERARLEHDACRPIARAPRA